ncbi:hypothetical protein JXO52_06300 [bacterium]|nr:hypothetical protein [bacterium]
MSASILLDLIIFLVTATLLYIITYYIVRQVLIKKIMLFPILSLIIIAIFERYFKIDKTEDIYPVILILVLISILTLLLHFINKIKAKSIKKIVYHAYAVSVLIVITFVFSQTNRYSFDKFEMLFQRNRFLDKYYAEANEHFLDKEYALAIEKYTLFLRSSNKDDDRYYIAKFKKSASELIIKSGRFKPIV